MTGWRKFQFTSEWLLRQKKENQRETQNIEREKEEAKRERNSRQEDSDETSETATSKRKRRGPKRRTEVSRRLDGDHVTQDDERQQCREDPAVVQTAR